MVPLGFEKFTFRSDKTIFLQNVSFVVVISAIYFLLAAVFSNYDGADVKKIIYDCGLQFDFIIMMIWFLMLWICVPLAFIVGLKRVCYSFLSTKICIIFLGFEC